jgi:hypothetical protein
MNIINGKFDNSIGLAICIFPVSSFKIGPATAELKDKMMEFTKFYAERLNQVVDRVSGPIMNHAVDSIDSGLSLYADKYKHILFMAAGAKIHDMSILFDIGTEIDSNPNYLAAGHILDWKGEYELHEQFVLVNCESWLAAGRPEYGGWLPGATELPVIERSMENFHHDYTPLWIKFTGEFRQQRHSKPGWNFYNAAARNNMTIINWNHTIRAKRTYYYPETDGQQLLESIKTMSNRGVTNPNQQALIRSLTTTKDQIWLLNSEDMRLPSGQYDTIALTASGFKFLEVFNKKLLSANGQLIIYDFNPLSIEWIKYLHTQTSTDITDLVQSWSNRENFKILGGQVLADSLVTQHFIASLKTTMDFYGGPLKFTELLQQFRQAAIVFVEVNLFQAPAKLTSKFQGTTLFNISNIFCTDYSNTYWGIAKTQAAFDALISSLVAPTLVIGHNARCELIELKVGGQ